MTGYLIQPELRPVLEQFFELEALERSADVIYALTPELRLGYVNPAWMRFAAANGGARIVSDWGLGCEVMRAVPEPQRPRYLELYRGALEQGKSPHPLAYDFECSSPSVYRLFRMHLFGLAGAGLLVVNSLRVEKPLAAPESTLSPTSPPYSDQHGLLHQCAHCRRMQHMQEDGRWDWIPAWDEVLPDNVSHTFCPLCMEFYYGQRLAELRQRETAD